MKEIIGWANELIQARYGFTTPEEKLAFMTGVMSEVKGKKFTSKEVVDLLKFIADKKGGSNNG